MIAKLVAHEAGVPGTVHGLRKAGARRAAEAGATEAQLNALFGWAPGSRESATYTRTADNARLARSTRSSRVRGTLDVQLARSDRPRTMSPGCGIQRRKLI